MSAASARAAPDITIPAAGPVNHLLHAAAWACDKLKPHAGKTARFSCAGFSAALTVSAAGTVQDAATDVAADAEFTLTPTTALRMAAGDDKAWHEIRIGGDAGFSSAVAYLAQHLRWDIEEDLSRVFGDVLAHRMAQTGRRVVRVQRQMAGDFARALTAHWTEERPLFANRSEIERFERKVAALHDDVERVAQRIESLLQNAH
ncbi:MAG TPA: SCP2 sterol-binding domain-containing protein [Burkholderiales bacterium]|nr:SCP2 sterol-binding domain-containing protein [Burkholderiales bacterium]